MILFVALFALVQVCAWVFGTFEGTQGYAFTSSGVEPRDFLVPMVLAPTMAAWLAAESVQWLRKTRVFDAPQKGSMFAVWFARASLGLGVGVLHIGLAGLLLAATRERAPDLAVMAVSGGLAAVFGLVFLPGKRRAGCPSCGYDWAGLPRCPECGTLHAAAGAASVGVSH